MHEYINHECTGITVELKNNNKHLIVISGDVELVDLLSLKLARICDEIETQIELFTDWLLRQRV